MNQTTRSAVKFSGLFLLVALMAGCGGDPNQYTGKFRIARNPNLKEYSISGDPLPNPESVLTVPHKQKILDRKMIMAAIELDNLQELETFAGLPNEEICDLISQRIEVVVDPADPELYEIRFAAKSKHNSRFVVDSVFGQYREYCSREFNKATHGWFQRHDASLIELYNQEEALRRQVAKNKSALGQLGDQEADDPERQRLEQANLDAGLEIERLNAERKAVNLVLDEYRKTNGNEMPWLMQSR